MGREGGREKRKEEKVADYQSRTDDEEQNRVFPLPIHSPSLPKKSSTAACSYLMPRVRGSTAACLRATSMFPTAGSMPVTEAPRLERDDEEGRKKTERMGQSAQKTSCVPIFPSP